MVEVNWTAEAESWMLKIFEHISKDSERHAQRTIMGIYERAEILSQHPEIGFPYGHLNDRNIKVILYGHYRIAYIIKDTENVDVIGVFHGALDTDVYFDRLE